MAPVDGYSRILATPQRIAPERNVLCDEELRARLQDAQRAGFVNAATAMERELQFRQNKDTKHAHTSNA